MKCGRLKAQPSKAMESLPPVQEFVRRVVCTAVMEYDLAVDA
jgi:hypothetical protein